MRFFKRLEEAMRRFGNFVSDVALTVFYFTVFALFAVPYRLARGADKAAKKSNFDPPSAEPKDLDGFRDEF